MYEQYLVSDDNRKKWVLRDRDKDYNNPCPICDMYKKDGKYVIYKDSQTMVMMNIYPYNVGHVMVVPKKHVISLEELNENEITELFKMVRKAVLLVKKTLKPKGFNIGINMGGHVVEASLDHLHVHIVPRYGADAGFMEITGTKVLIESLEKTKEKLLKNVDLLKD